VFEVLRVSDSIKRLVMEGRSSIDVRDAAVQDGMILMQQCGVRKVLDGTTTPEEVLRVLYVEEE
jgi:type II secretory ATPase GspE/PulE/Tfp pilus assembly ATPase PilB-like protein